MRWTLPIIVCVSWLSSSPCLAQIPPNFHQQQVMQRFDSLEGKLQVLHRVFAKSTATAKLGSLSRKKGLDFILKMYEVRLKYYNDRQREYESAMSAKISKHSEN